MSVLVDKNTRLLVQGISGKTGAFHTKGAKEYGTNVVAPSNLVCTKRTGDSVPSPTR